MDDFSRIRNRGLIEDVRDKHTAHKRARRQLRIADLEELQLLSAPLERDQFDAYELERQYEAMADTADRMDDAFASYIGGHEYCFDCGWLDDHSDRCVQRMYEEAGVRR